jgi:Cohesin domain
MNDKENKKMKSITKKSLFTLALIFFIAVPMLFAMGTVKAAYTGPYATVVKSGTTTTQNWSPVLSTNSGFPNSFKVDVRIDSATPLTIWGWAINNINWDPSVLKLVKVQIGSFLTANTGDGVNSVGTNSAQWDNTVGTVNGGIASADSDYSTPQTSDTSGILATLTFQMIGYGKAVISISNVNIRAYSADTTGTMIPANSGSVLLANVPAIGTISAVQSGTTVPNTPIVVAAGQTTVTVDVRIDGASNVWGWSTKVTWDPTKLQLTHVSQGNFLTDTDSSAFFVGSNSGQWDNVIGAINGGIAGSLSSGGTAVATDTSGVLATLTFQVIGSGSSTITLASGNLRSYSDDSAGTGVTTNSVTVNASQFVLPEYQWGALIAMISAFVAFIAFAAVKKTIHIPSFSKHI